MICVIGTYTLRGVTYNLSKSGIQIEVPELKRRTNVRLTFRLPGSEAIIDALGAVVWQSAKRHGIKLKYLGEQSQDSIRHFIEERTVA